MATRDFHRNHAMKQLLKAAAVTTTQTSASVDTRGHDELELLIAIGDVADLSASPVGDGSWTFKLQDSDNNSTFADVVDSNFVLVGSAQSPVVAPNATTGVFLTVDAATEDDKTYRVGYVGPKRYVRVVGTAVLTPGSTPLWIGAILGRPAVTPTPADT